MLTAFLPRFNARFGVPAAQPGSAYGSVGTDLDLESRLCIKHQRRVAKDNTVLYQQHALQLFPTPDHLSYAGATVEVQERLDGQLVVCFQGRAVASRACGGAVRPSLEGLWGRGVVGVQNGPRVPSSPGQVQADALLRQVDEARLAWHSQQIKEGMERARKRGQRIGRPRVSDGYRTRPDFIRAEKRIRAGELSVRRAAQQLAMGYNTLKRLLSSQGSMAPLTKSVDNSP